MISYEAFVENFRIGGFTRLNFFYDDREYVLARETDPETDKVLFVCAGEDKAEEFETVDELFSTVRFSSHTLSEIWKSVKIVANDTLKDRDYAAVLYGDTLGNIVDIYTGTVEMRDRYLTQYFIPAFTVCALAILALVICTMYVETLSWTIFAIVASVVVLAFLVSQIAYFGNSTKFQRGNPRSALYLFDDGAVVLTDQMVRALPFTELLRVNAEHGISIVSYKTVYSFTPSLNGNAAEFMQKKVAEIKARRKAILRNAFRRKV